MRKKKREREKESQKGSGDPIQTSQRMAEPGREESDAFWEGGGANGDYREEMLAEMEKEVMMVSVVRCESELTSLEVGQ